MSPQDAGDPERREPSFLTPRCAICDEAAQPQFGGYCFRHAGTSVGLPTARAAVRKRRG